MIVTSAAAKLKTDAQAFRDAMRKLWEDHITWTRLTIVSLANDLPDTQPTALLQEHVIIAAEIIQAAKVGDTAAQNDAIAEFLYSAKPENWPIDEMKAMMREHLTLQEAEANLTRDHADSIAAHEQIHLQALVIADMLSDRIIRQFPNKFK